MATSRYPAAIATSMNKKYRIGNLELFIICLLLSSVFIRKYCTLADA
jgi:hypothetical protein